MKYRFAAAMLITVLLLSACGKTIETDDTSVMAEFDDTGTVTSLELTDISELTELTDYKNLETLDLNGLQITDWTPVKVCSSLKYLNAAGTGMTAEVYEELSAALPACNILWDIPVACETFPSNSEEITLPACDMSGLENLDLFTELQTLDACACTDEAAVCKFAETNPELTVVRTVTICGQKVVCGRENAETVDLTTENITSTDDLEGVQLLPEGTVVDLRGTERSVEEIQSISENYLNVQFLFSFNVFGVSADSTTEELDLSGIQVSDLNDVRVWMPYLTGLKKLVMCNCGPSNEEMAELRDEYPDIKVVWMLHLGGTYYFRTDAEAFSTLVDGEHYWVTSSDCEVFQYCTDLKALDLGHQHIRSIEWLKYLPKLRVLILADNYVSDITPLAYLKNLTYVELFMNFYIDSVESMRDLTNLVDVNLAYLNRIKDFEPLWDHPNLQRLYIIRCGISPEQREGIKEHVPEGCDLLITENQSSTGGNWRIGERYEALRDMFRSGVYNDIFEPAVIYDNAGNPME